MRKLQCLNNEQMDFLKSGIFFQYFDQIGKIRQSAKANTATDKGAQEYTQPLRHIHETEGQEFTQTMRQRRKREHTISKTQEHYADTNTKTQMHKTTYKH